MSTVEEIQSAIEKLPSRERGKLRSWFMAKDSRDWDRQIEKDAKAGKLDGLAGEALAEWGPNC
jgi:hypothetical protein